MKKLILTIDYELFLGNDTGTVESCMIQPTEELANILSINNSKMTVFWDILHFYKLIELEKKHEGLKIDRIAIETQILNLAKSGHDIQLHLHPHWLDAKYINKNWVFPTYKRFKLHNLSKKNDSNDIDTIVGCVSISKKLLENTVRKVVKDYSVTTFRAGGYLIEPFDEIGEALYENGIYIDSSVCPELKNESNVFSYNFKNYPKFKKYRFDNNISEVDDSGKFIEIPISSIEVPVFKRLYFTLLKRIKYRNIESIKKGKGSGSNHHSKGNYKHKILSYIKDKKYQKLTTDNSFKEKYNYLLNKAKNNSTMILHSKMLNDHTMNLLDSKLAKNEVKFISIKNFIDKNNISIKI